jgi:hypothetical protein
MPVPFTPLGYVAIVNSFDRTDMQAAQTFYAFMLPYRLTIGAFYIIPGTDFFA